MGISLCGVLNLDKPSGMTSRAVVDLVARPLRGLKVGHAGTLDPLASGVLVVCVGAATRLIELVQRMPKTYRTVIRLGARSDTLDADGTVVDVEAPRVPSVEEVLDVLGRQVGTIVQIPPAFSALRVSGRRAYDLARAGHTVELSSRPVRIDRIDLLSYQWPKLELEIECGSGTYVRSIARDVGESLGCGGLVEVLVRRSIGRFTQDDAVDPHSLSSETIPGLLRPALEAAVDLPRITIRDEDVSAVALGRPLDGHALGMLSIPSGQIALVRSSGELVAIAEWAPDTAQVLPRRVLVKQDDVADHRAGATVESPE